METIPVLSPETIRALATYFKKPTIRLDLFWYVSYRSETACKGFVQSPAAQASQCACHVF
jgi:hypothetical protein